MSNAYDIYTDGSCHPNPGPAGWAAILLPSRLNNAQLPVRELQGSFTKSTISRMELFPVVAALRALDKPSLIVIHTDSKYVRNMFEKGWVDNWMLNGWRTRFDEPVSNRDLIEAILEFRSFHRFTFKWTPGHAGNRWNERADALAVIARVDQITGPTSIDVSYMERST